MNKGLTCIWSRKHNSCHLLGDLAVTLTDRCEKLKKERLILHTAQISMMHYHGGKMEEEGREGGREGRREKVGERIE